MKQETREEHDRKILKGAGRLEQMLSLFIFKSIRRYVERSDEFRGFWENTPLFERIVFAIIQGITTLGLNLSPIQELAIFVIVSERLKERSDKHD